MLQNVHAMLDGHRRLKRPEKLAYHNKMYATSIHLQLLSSSDCHGTGYMFQFQLKHDVESNGDPLSCDCREKRHSGYATSCVRCKLPCPGLHPTMGYERIVSWACSGGERIDWWSYAGGYWTVDCNRAGWPKVVETRFSLCEELGRDGGSK